MWIGSLWQNWQKYVVRTEVESWKAVFLGLQISCKWLLAQFKLLHLKDQKGLAMLMSLIQEFKGILPNEAIILSWCHCCSSTPHTVISRFIQNIMITGNIHTNNQHYSAFLTCGFSKAFAVTFMKFLSMPLNLFASWGSCFAMSPLENTASI